MARPRLYLNHPAELDWLIALEFGRVDDGQPPDWWEGISEDFGWLRDGPRGPIVGFKVLNFATFDAAGEAHAAIWTGPRFDAPLVGLVDASAGEIVVAADALLEGRPTVVEAIRTEFEHRLTVADIVGELPDLPQAARTLAGTAPCPR